LVKVG